MEAWAGMERLLHLSMGIQVGASGVALIAVLELKRSLQYPVKLQGQFRTSDCIVRLTAEEWRSVAGIQVRKTFERAKAKLEELGILRIVRNGKLLEVTLWPDPLELTDVCTRAEVDKDIELSPEPALELGSPEESVSEEFKLVSKPEIPNDTPIGLQVSNETRLRTSCGTELETRGGTGVGTSFGTSRETCPGTGFATNPVLTTLSETGTVSLSERALRCREDKVFPTADVTKNVAYPTLLDKLALLRYPLNRQTKENSNTNVGNVSNVSNGTTNNEQRSNERCAAPDLKEISLLDFAIHWVQEVGHPLTPYEKEGLVRFMRLGYQEELFVEALRCAVAADNRRMGYVLGILRNWYQQGVRCLQDVAEVKKSWEDLRFLKRAKIG